VQASFASRELYCIQECRPHEGSVTAVLWCEAAGLIVSLGDDRTLAFTDPLTSHTVTVVEEVHQELVHSMAVRPPDPVQGSIEDDPRYIRRGQAWPHKFGLRPEEPFSGESSQHKKTDVYSSSVTAVVAEELQGRSYDIGTLATASGDKSVRLWELSLEFSEAGLTPPLTVKVTKGVAMYHSSEVVAVAWSRKEAVWISAADDGSVKVWGPQGKPLHKIHYRGYPPTALCVDDLSRHVLVGSQDGSLKVYDIEEGALQEEYAGHPEAGIRAIVHVPQMGQYISSGWDMALRVWEAHPRKAKSREDADLEASVEADRSEKKSARSLDLYPGVVAKVVFRNVDEEN